MIDDPRLPKRFWAKVSPEPNGGCWLWAGSGQRQGYGHYCIGNMRMVKAHRAAYEALVGPIPRGLHLDHLCCTPACVNPAHLEPVTNAENHRRASLRRMPPERLHAALEDHGWNKAATARALGIARSHIIRLVRRYRLRRESAPPPRTWTPGPQGRGSGPSTRRERRAARGPILEITLRPAAVASLEVFAARSKVSRRKTVTR